VKGGRVEYNVQAFNMSILYCNMVETNLFRNFMTVGSSYNIVPYVPHFYASIVQLLSDSCFTKETF